VLYTRRNLYPFGPPSYRQMAYLDRMQIANVEMICV
jgi:hypothetical protein